MIFLQSKNEAGFWKITGPMTTYGLFFVGPVTHYFYNVLESLFSKTSHKVLFERLVFCPIFLLCTLYILERLNVSIHVLVEFQWCIFFQGSSHAETWMKLKKIYCSALQANWKIWTVPQLINLNLVPVQYRVLFANAVAFFWNIYLASKTSSRIKSE